ncbi:efflux RND transporter periplasmic adaptor subunit [Gelidibacter japonicus]|uniref:efflux RND transporter periplasmic adaptor subunit n=1 Tax=Gelidibacter japonicus TaxID=1962232 RepID=UPI0013D42683|nr:efflux RND transporter periplasmic adaptor subunit [Gelidibacter japonicus]
MKKRIIIIASIVGVVLLFAFILQNNKKKNEREVTLVAETNSHVAIRTSTVTSEKVNGTFEVNGTFMANKTAEIASEVSGQIASILVEEGDVVKAGQVVASLTGDKANVNVINAKATLDNALQSLKRYESAHKTGGITTMELDQARLQVENAQAQYQSAQLGSGDTQIRSKISGIVNKKMVEPGMIVSSGTVIIEVVDISSLKLRVEVDEALVNHLNAGDNATIVPGVSKETFNGKITFIAPASNGALKFPVEITIENKDQKLRAGMYATAKFDTGGEQNTLTIPRTAFVGSVSNNQVFVVRGETAHLISVRSGVNYGDKVEILDGLKSGDLVVTSGHINLQDGTKVRVLAP